MSKLKILQEGTSYTFDEYFELPNDTDEVLAPLKLSFLDYPRITIVYFIWVIFCSIVQQP